MGVFTIPGVGVTQEPHDAAGRCQQGRGRPGRSKTAYACDESEEAGTSARKRRNGSRQMKVLEGLAGGIEPGSTVSVADLGLPVNGKNGVLLVFWKST